MAIKVTPSEEKSVVKAKAGKPAKIDPKVKAWWNSNSKKELQDQVLATAAYLKQNQQYRIRQASIYTRIYGNMPLFHAVGSNFARMNQQQGLPIDRPTMNVVQSCVDTLVSRITQSRPRPMFLTDNGDHKMRTLAKQMNRFTLGEFYQTKAYQMGVKNLRDAAVLGTGCVQVYENEKRVALDRVLQTELYVDPNEAMYGSPRQLIRLKLVDRSVLMEAFPEKASMIEKAEQGFPEAMSEASGTIANQIIVAEAWHLPSGKDATDGLHTIVASSGILLEEPYQKPKFPFVFLDYTPRLLGFWGQPLTEQLLGTQVEINKLLITISKSINIMGVPRVWIEDGSKVVKAHFNNDIGMIGTYRGIAPIVWEGTSGIAQDIYAQLQRLVDYAYQQSGVSMLAAQSNKPAGLNSGEALREFDNNQTDRFAELVRRYDDYYIDLAYQMIDLAKDIAERDGSYQTVYPDKDGTRTIDLPDAKMLSDPFVIQCFDTSSLPREPAARKEYVVEMMQAGIYSTQEGRRLLGFADTEQVDKLEIAAEERILQYLDAIVEEGHYTGPDQFMDLALAHKLVIQYFNLYVPAKLSPSRVELLINFKTQVEDLMQEALSPPAGGALMPGSPMAVPNPQPSSDLLPVSPSPAMG